MLKHLVATCPAWRLRVLVFAWATVMVFGVLWSAVIANAVETATDPPAWSKPSAMAIKRVSVVASAQHEPNLLDNLDCVLVTYRLAATSSMQTGCFTETSFGLLDSDTDTVIFNGTDEGLPLLSYSAHEILVPWPGALDMVALDNVNTGGSYISLYKNPLAVMSDTRNILLQLTAKQLIAPPELPLKDPTGQRLIINPQTLAFSDDGSWLVVETLGGSFVRINLATLDMTAFAPAYGSQGSPALLKSRLAVSSNGRYVAIANDVAASFKVYDLATCDATKDKFQPNTCQAYDYWPFADTQIGSLRSIRHVRFVNDRLLSFEATSGNPASGGVYEMSPAASIGSLIDYLGLGDSYTSGEGAYNYVADTDSANNMCHLSVHSYPFLLTRDLYSSLGGHSVACSGAVIKDIGSTAANYRGQVRNVPSFQDLEHAKPELLTSIMTNFAPGYVAQQRFVQKYQPAVVTVSVGGDDIGFGDIVLRCVMPHVSRHLSDSDCYNTYEDRLELTKLVDRTVPRWVALYKQLSAASPGTRLYAIGYPTVASDTGNCALNAHLGKNELEFSQELIHYLNDAVKKAADKAGITYVDIGQALAGHRLCETASYNVAVNGLTAGTDGGLFSLNIFGKESYHPNALGQALIEQAILKQTHNLTSAVTAAVSSSPTDLLKVPKTGRQVYTLVPDNALLSRVVKPSQSTVLQARGTRDGLKARTAYAIRLDGPTGAVLGTVSSNDTGDISAVITLPPSTAPGGHAIDVTGDNQSGEPADVTQPIYVPVSNSDSDGDGVDDAHDTCPTAINSGQDSDRDGIDDTCDGFIGPPATPNPSNLPGNTTASGQNTFGSSAVPDGNSTTVAAAVSSPQLASTIIGFTGTNQRTRPATWSIQPAIGTTLNTKQTRNSQAANSEVAIPKAPKTPSLGKPTDKTVMLRHRPHLMHWLPWVVLAFIAWLILILLVVYWRVCRLTNQRRQPGYI